MNNHNGRQAPDSQQICNNNNIHKESIIIILISY